MRRVKEIKSDILSRGGGYSEVYSGRVNFKEPVAVKSQGGHSQRKTLPRLHEYLSGTERGRWPRSRYRFFQRAKEAWPWPRKEPV